jgi:hypothetical protein
MKMKKVSRSRWAMLAFVLACVIVLINLPASAEQIWTDFSPKPVGEQDATTGVVVDHLVPIAQEVFGRGIDLTDTVTEAEVKTDNEINKEKYRVYFEDESLVLMVLGGVEYWRMNCGSLTSTGEYFVALAIKKHGIDEEEMHMDMSFQTGLFAATLYNSCDHFLAQVQTIGLDMMFIQDDTYLIQGGALNNIQNSEV